MIDDFTEVTELEDDDEDKKAPAAPLAIPTDPQAKLALAGVV